jgi:SAM-dependent methyltransferase
VVELESSGERLIEDAYLRSPEAYLIYVMHIAAYRFAERMCEGKAVLDLGCGTGYGSARIARVAASVHGVDVDEDAVRFASTRHVESNLVYSPISPSAPLPFRDESFDVVLSFQVIEHVDDDRRYLREANRVLRTGGTLIVVTPDRRHRLLPGQRPWNRWHVREYSARQLARKISAAFDLEQSLRMGAPWEIARMEIRRYRKTMWLTLPFTLPFIPDALRRKLLDFLHSLRSPPPRVRADDAPASRSFGFDENALVIDANPPNSLNLVMVATKAGPGRQ